MLHDDWLGPVDYLVATLPGGQAGQEGIDLLLGLVDTHQVRLLDVEVVRRDGDDLVVLEPDGVDDLDLHELDGARSGLLDDDDLTTLVQQLTPGERAIVVVYEVLLVHPVLEAWTAGGGRVLAEGPVTVEDLTVALGVDDEEVGA